MGFPHIKGRSSEHFAVLHSSLSFSWATQKLSAVFCGSPAVKGRNLKEIENYINPKGKFILSPQEQRQGASV